MLRARKQHSNDALARQPTSGDTQQLFFENYTSDLTESHQKVDSSIVLIPPRRFSLPTTSTWRTYHMPSHSTSKRRHDPNFHVLIPKPTSHHIRKLVLSSVICDLPSPRLAVSSATMNNNDGEHTIHSPHFHFSLHSVHHFHLGLHLFHHTSSYPMTSNNRRVPNRVSEVPPIIPSSVLHPNHPTCRLFQPTAFYSNHLQWIITLPSKSKMFILRTLPLAPRIAVRNRCSRNSNRSKDGEDKIRRQRPQPLG